MLKLKIIFSLIIAMLVLLQFQLLVDHLYNSYMNRLTQVKIDLIELQQKNDELRSQLTPEIQPRIDQPAGQVIQSKAAWYDYSLNGSVWSKEHRTTAARDYPKGSTLHVCNLQNNLCVNVLVNDYGPQQARYPERALDLSSKAFSLIADLNSGVINVSVERIN